MNYTEIFNDSHQRIFQNEAAYGDFFSSFYKEFFARGEHIKKFFLNTDLARQKLMLRRSFLFMIDFHISRTASDKLIHIAEIHIEHGIYPELYDEWLESLVVNVKKFDSDFNNDVALSWRLVMLPGIEFLRFYYNNAKKM